MRPTTTELITLLEKLLYECREHNADYHHRTSNELLIRTAETIDKLEQFPT